MAKIKIEVEANKCERCSHTWVQRGKEEPKVCPKCFPPDTIISGCYNNIINVKKGDNVIGISGNICKVKKRFNHNFIGELLEIKASGCLPIKITPHHKVFRIHCEQKSNSKDRKFKRTYYEPELIEASLLSKRPKCKNINHYGDYLVIPRLKGTFDKNKIPLHDFTTKHGLKVLKGKNIKPFINLDKDSAWVFGLYVAEGFSSSKGEIFFSLGKHRKKQIKTLCSKLKKLGFHYRAVEVETAMNIIISSRVKARAFREWFGHTAKNKKIPDFIILNKDKEIYKNFLDGYIEGDGYCSICEGKSIVKVTTVSITLALQLQLLSIRMNDFFNITKFDYSKYVSFYKGRKIQGGVQYILRTNAGNISKLRGMYNPPRYNKSHVNFKDYVAVPINDISKIKYKGCVYNIETEEGNYLASNISVKNCKSPYWCVPKNPKLMKKLIENSVEV